MQNQEVRRPPCKFAVSDADGKEMKYFDNFDEAIREFKTRAVQNGTTVMSQVLYDIEINN